LLEGPWSSTFVADLLCLSLADLVWRRTPNGLTATTLIGGCLYWMHSAGPSGLQFALWGSAVGFAVTLPLYLGKWVGAGDIKVMAALGAWLGPTAAWHGGLAGLCLGGPVSLLILWSRGVTPMMLYSGYCVTGVAGAIERARQTHTTIPLAVALVAGTLGVSLKWLP
jgi:prepilin peptidase CpaA